jgi:hypothetical protein
MKHKFLRMAAMLAMVSGQSLAADVGVSISVGEPGFYGRLDIGNFPPPQLIYPRPIVIQPVAGVVYEPIYLRVPPAHAGDWRRYCNAYGACGRPVYFVQDRWYNEVYVPHYRQYRERGDHPGKGYAKGHGKGHDRGS